MGDEFHFSEQHVLRTLTVAGLNCTYRESGSGRPLLFLHGDSGPTAFGDACLDALSSHFRVVAPWHPGFGPSEGPASFKTVTDLAYFYLDFAEALGLHDCILVGESFGGWIAAEMMISKSPCFSHLILVSPFGIKAGDHTSRDFCDLFATSAEQILELSFVNRDIGRRDPGAMGDRELDEMVRGQIALAHYGWQPYMHNPQLAQWLHRIKTPTLIVRGEHDGIVVPRVHEAFRDRIEGARLVVVPDAGHFPNVEKPALFSKMVADFAGVLAPARASAAV